MAESKTTAKKAPAKKPVAKKPAPRKAPAKESNGLVLMVNDEGKTANVHPSMVDDYKTGGYKEA